MGPIQVVVQDGNNLVLEVTPTPSTTVILDRGIAGPVGPVGPGDVNGPASSTDNAVARFDGITGKLIQNSVVTIGDTGNMAGVGTLAVTDLTDSSLTAGRVTYAGTGGNLVDSANLTFNGTTLTANALTVTNATTLNAGTANGVAYLNGSKVLTTGSGLTYVNNGALTLNSPDNAVLVLNATFGAGASILDFTASGSTAQNTRIVGGAGSSSNLSFVTSGSEQMRLTSTGLGIGTSSPNTRLTIGGYSSANQTPDIQITRSSSGTIIQTGPNITFADGTTNNTTTLQVTQGRFGVWNYGSGSWNERMSIDASGNMGLGVTPSAWGSDSSRRGFDISTYGGLTSNSLAMDLVANAFFNGTNWVAKTTGAGTKYLQTGGSHFWQFAGSVSAGSQPSYTTGMTLNASGNLGIGTSSPVGRLTVQGAAGTNGINQGIGLLYSNGSQFGALGLNNSSGWPQLMARASAGLTFHVNSDLLTTGEAMRLDASGNLGVGTSSPSVASGSGVAIYSSSVARLALRNAATGDASTDGSGIFVSGSDFGIENREAGNIIFYNASERMRLDSSGNLGLGVTPSAWNSLYRAFQIGTLSSVAYDNSFGGTVIANNAYGTGSNAYAYINPTALQAARYDQQLGVHRWFTAPSGTAGNAISFTQAMTLDASGNLLVGQTTANSGNPVNSNSAALTLGGNGATWTINHSATSAGSLFAQFGYSGTKIGSITVATSSTVAYNTSSDYRLKNITGPITTSGAYIDSLNPVEGTWKADGSTFVGLIAHEVQEASRTNVATGVKDGEEMQGMDYSSAEIIANMLAELKSLRARVAQLETN